MSPLRLGALLLSYSAAIVSSAWAEVKLPAVLADRMVIQRDLPVHIWGMANAGEEVSVTFRGATRANKADTIGRWSVYLPPGAAGGPFELTVKGTNTVTLRDVLVGDVWIASGQSNMEWTLAGTANATAEIEKANYPRIRLFLVKHSTSEHPVDDVEAQPWTPCTPESAHEFSAVAYYFGRDLHERLGIPIGLIESNWGGTPAEAWTSLGALSADASLMPVFSEWARMMDAQSATQIRRERQLKEWERASSTAKAVGRPAPAFPWAPNERNSWRPAALYNAMIAPLTLFPIRGAIWYQGESNASKERAPLYNRLFETMIRDWRQAWGIGDFPFLFVQLANFKTGPDSWWPVVRDAQRQTLALRNTAMAVTIDIGDPTNIHPANKQDVGKRLALGARAVAYGEKLEYSGPLFRQAVREGAGLRVFFDHANRLTARGGVLRGFEIAGPDRKFTPADARIDGSTVLVSSGSVSSPAYVRYGWADNPDVNLYNAEGLPASPFRSGD